MTTTAELLRNKLDQSRSAWQKEYSSFVTAASNGRDVDISKLHQLCNQLGKGADDFDRDVALAMTWQRNVAQWQSISDHQQNLRELESQRASIQSEYDETIRKARERFEQARLEIEPKLAECQVRISRAHDARAWLADNFPIEAREQFESIEKRQQELNAERSRLEETATARRVVGLFSKSHRTEFEVEISKIDDELKSLSDQLRRLEEDSIRD